MKEFFTVRRNRRAAQSAWFCMVSTLSIFFRAEIMFSSMNCSLEQ
jgi:hypothetical protein